MSKKMIIIIVIVLVVIVIGIVGFVFYLTSGPVKSADNFFSLIKNGDLNGAYESTSEQFKQNTTAEQFKSFLESSSIINFNSSFWSSRSVDQNGATLTGSFKTKDDKTIPLEVSLVKENGQWKILSLDIKGGVLQAKTIPSEANLIKLTNDTMFSFAEAVKNGDFSNFYDSLSKLWQNQTTAQKLKGVFQSFVDAKSDLTVLESVTPVFGDKPIIQDNGLLVLTGYYLYQGSTVNFQFKYIYENTEWKLAGIDVSKK
jgi:hypothetical protein